MTPEVHHVVRVVLAISIVHEPPVVCLQLLSTQNTAYKYSAEYTESINLEYINNRIALIGPIKFKVALKYATVIFASPKFNQLLFKHM